MKNFPVIGHVLFLKKGNEEKCKVKVLPWQQFLSEFRKNCREVMLDLYEGIVKV